MNQTTKRKHTHTQTILGDREYQELKKKSFFFLLICKSRHAEKGNTQKQEKKIYKEK